MGTRRYTLIDAQTPSYQWLWSDWDRVVRFMEYVRANFDSIVPGVPDGCEVDLFAGRHAHNPGLVPLIGFYRPVSVVDPVPDMFFMIDTVSEWCAALPESEVQAITLATDAPTWEELQQIHVYPSRAE